MVKYIPVDIMTEIVTVWIENKAEGQTILPKPIGRINKLILQGNSVGIKSIVSFDKSVILQLEALKKLGIIDFGYQTESAPDISLDINEQVNQENTTDTSSDLPVQKRKRKRGE